LLLFGTNKEFSCEAFKRIYDRLLWRVYCTLVRVYNPWPRSMCVSHWQNMNDVFTLTSLLPSGHVHERRDLRYICIVHSRLLHCSRIAFYASLEKWQLAFPFRTMVKAIRSCSSQLRNNPLFKYRCCFCVLLITLESNINYLRYVPIAINRVAVNIIMFLTLQKA